jgi:very-short-patch-repair endonuclease
MRESERFRTEITVPRALKRRDGLHIHQAGLAADEITLHRGIPVSTPARTLLDLAAVLTAQQLERAATEAEIRRLGSPTALADLVGRHPRPPGTPAIRRLLETRAIGRHVTKQELELRFLALLDAHGIERPRINAKIHLEPEPKEVDCLWPEPSVVVELDGYATHGTRRAFEEDRARDRALVVAGYRVVRITWRQLQEEAPALARQLRTITGMPGTRGAR